MEIQIIKGLCACEIESVIFDFEPPQSILEALAKHRISSSVNTMPALPAYSQESFVRDVVSTGP